MAQRRPKWQMTKTEGGKFARAVLKMLKSAGAKPNTGEFSSMYNMRVKTGAGELLVDTKRIDEGTVFTRFRNPTKGAKCVGNSNPYSGKWNFHFGRVGGSSAATYFKSSLAHARLCNIGK